jgi:hypothetical protein
MMLAATTAVLMSGPANSGDIALTGNPAPGPIAVGVQYTVTSTWTPLAGQYLMGQTLYATSQWVGPPPHTDGPSSKGTKTANPASWNLVNEAGGVGVSVYCIVGWWSLFGNGDDQSTSIGPWTS